MKKYLFFPILIVTINLYGQQLPGFGLTGLKYFDLTHNPGNIPIIQTSWIKKNLDSLNVPIVRQMENHGLTWDYMETPNNSFHFLKADSLIIINPVTNFFAELFYSRGATSDLRFAPWDTSHLYDSASYRQDYVLKVVSHYKNYIDFWEIGNEQSHGWMARVFQPYQYANLVQETSPTIYSTDPGSKIVLSGLGSPEDEWNTNDSNIVWLDSVLIALGNNPGQYFDIVDCHMYIDWYRIPVFIRKIQSILNQHGCGNKFIMVGENGISSDYSNTWPLAGVGTKQQANEIFTRMCLAVASGAVQSNWFSHIDGFGNNGNFQGYGSVYHEPNGLISQKPSWYSLQLLYNELVNFTSVQMISEGDSLTGNGNYVIKFIIGGQEKYVAWNVNGSNYTLTGLTGNSAQIKNTVCNTSIQTIGSLTDEWPALVNNNPVFQTNTASISGGNLNLTLSSTPILITINNNTGITEENENQTFSIYPNPFSSQTILQTNKNLQNATLTIENIFGQTVSQIKNISGHTVILNRDNLATGLYFVRLMQGNKILIVKKTLITD
ncbi:MAG: T9SS type A sorting domain-containing protein [Bacteroidia bacterium]|nr:T9SS type A sorting domain-containing protein [Bacteroidia bacterium]